ncbi:MAG: ACT domain-containing protein [Erythrobacter sp.]
MQPSFVRDLQAMLRGMEPKLSEFPYRFLALPLEDAQAEWLRNPFAVIREDEAATFVIETLSPETTDDLYARITLRVQSALDDVGLTAAVATGLAAEGIPCNVIAAFHHDHLFVPWGRRDDALVILNCLSEEAAGR